MCNEDIAIKNPDVSTYNQNEEIGPGGKEIAINC